MIFASNCIIPFILYSYHQVAKAETLSLLINGEGVRAMFRIQMFRFDGVSYIFLHGKVQICHNTAAVWKLISSCVCTCVI